jgi:hypothetical protein
MSNLFTNAKFPLKLEAAKIELCNLFRKDNVPVDQEFEKMVVFKLLAHSFLMGHKKWKGHLFSERNLSSVYHDISWELTLLNR